MTPPSAEERRKKVQTDLEMIDNSLAAAEAKIPEMRRAVRGMLELVKPKEETEDAGDADEAGDGEGAQDG